MDENNVLQEATKNTSYTCPAAPVITPPAVTTGAASGVTYNGAILGLNVTNVGSPVITARGIIYSTNSAPSATNGTIQSATGAIASGPATVNVTGLTASTTYYFRAYVLSGTNYTYGSISSFTTLSNNLPVVSTGTPTNIEATTATVPLTTSGSGITTRGIAYSYTNPTPTTGDSTKSVSGTTGTISVDLTGLSSNQYYYARAYATNSYGTAYGEVRTFTTKTTASGSGATTGSVDSIRATSAEVDITTSNTGSYDVEERGVVYSTSRSSDSDLQLGKSGCYTQTVYGTTGSATVFISGLSRNTTYYVRAYAQDTRGNVVYGAIKNFKTLSSDDLPEVETRAASAVGSRDIDVDINVTDDGGYAITERGVVYSRTNVNPQVSGSSSDTAKDSEKKTGRVTISLTNLNANTTYYVRAYAKNSRGTAYGEILEVPLGSSDVTTNNVTSITGTSATAGGYVSSSVNSSVQERGVVYSTSTSPTVNDYTVKASTSSYGDFNVNLTNLSANTKYYVRAYIRTGSSKYTYGNTVSFTTSNSAVGNVTVQYMLSTGVVVGTQQISAVNGQVITAANLIVPVGYRLLNPVYNYASNGTAVTVTILVEKIGNATPYMVGAASYRFEPDRAATRIEIAKMVYALKGSPVIAGTLTFSDIPAGYAEQAAVNYVTAMNIMVGYPDGSFKPNNSITRAEVAVICNAVYRYTPATSAATFSDVRTHWAAQAIATASKGGAIYGYPDGTFKPDANISRAESCSLFANAEGRTLEPLGTAQFSDVPATHWAYKYIMNAATPRP
jgi:hypothetical protein